MFIFKTIVLTTLFISIIFWIYKSYGRYLEIGKIYVTNYDLTFESVIGFKNKISEYYFETSCDNRERIFHIKYFINQFDAWSYILINEDRSKSKHIPMAVKIMKWYEPKRKITTSAWCNCQEVKSQ